MFAEVLARNAIDIHSPVGLKIAAFITTLQVSGSCALHCVNPHSDPRFATAKHEFIQFVYRSAEFGSTASAETDPRVNSCHALTDQTLFEQRNVSKEFQEL